MKFKKLFLSVSLFSIILITACTPAIKPTDRCEFEIPVSDLYAEEDFDYIDFFDFSIEIAKEHRFQPPMLYDENAGLLVFGNKDVPTMPGLKIVVYMWIDKRTDNVCINYHILNVKGSTVSVAMAREVILDFKDELEQKYSERIANRKRIFEKYQSKERSEK